MHKRILLLVLASLLSGCSHLGVTIPTPIIESPEISGAESFRAGLGVLLQSGHYYESTSDASQRPPNLASPNSVHKLSTIGNVNADFAQRFRLGVGGDPINGGIFGKAQIQILGEGRANAKAGSFSMSVFGHAGNHTPDKSGDQSSTFGPGGNPWNAEIKTGWYDFGASIGYRMTDSAKVFIGAAKQFVWYQTKVEQLSGVAPLGTYYASDKGEANRAMLGIAWGSAQGELFIAADYTDIRYQRAPDLYIASATLGATADFK